MIEGKFDVVFRGQIVKNFDEETVKQNLVKLFKSSPDAIGKLFTGQEVPIRKGLDYTAAMKYQSALRNAGALALIKEVEQEKQQLQASNSSKASFASAEESASNEHESEKPAQAAAEKPAPQVTSEDTSAAQQQAATEGEFSLAEVGAQIMPDKVYEKREVDTSELSLAAAGERILPQKAPEDHPQPKTDHLSITDDTSPVG